MSGLDWPGLMRTGLALGLRPTEFWALTPAELMYLTGRTGAGALNRARLAELAALYPDTAGDD